MKTLSVCIVALLLCTGGAAHCQAPLTAAGQLQILLGIVEGNKTLLDKQKKTLDLLDQMEETAQQLKIFGKRS